MEDLTVPEARSLAEDAVIWGLPLVMMGRYLSAAGSTVEFNRFFMNSDIADARSHAVGPNIDTMNGRSWIDLSAGPQVIGVPDTADRYYSIQLQDMYMNSFAYIGRRTTGTQTGYFAVTPPGYNGSLPHGVTEIRATTTKVMAFVRTLVRGAADTPAVRAINGQFTIGALADFPAGRHKATVSPDALDLFQPASRRATGLLPHEEIIRSGAAFFDDVAALTSEFPPLPADAARFSALRLELLRQQDPQMLSEAVQHGIVRAQKALVTRSANGWARRDNVQAFITDPLQRAGNNIFGPNTQIALESVFFNNREGPDGRPLSGENCYRLYFAADQLPPVDAFWSLSLYDKSYKLFDNPIDRYGVTDRTDGLQHGPDGSLDIRIQADPPDDPRHNWLPSPRDGFQLILRTYQPRLPLLDESYLPPPLEIRDAA